jgi:hypothetical protein
MSLWTSRYLMDLEDEPLPVNSDAGWQAVSRGLLFVVVGYLALIAGSVLGLLLIRLGVEDGPVIQHLNRDMEDRETFLLLGLAALGLTALFSYGLVLVGQWHCLRYAPQHQHAKELMYLCFNCLVVGSALNVAGAYLDGARTYAALRGGLDEVNRLDLGSTGNVLLLASMGLGLVASLVFSQFLRNVASYFRAEALVRSVDLNLAFVGLLLGGSLGTLFLVRRGAPKAELLPWLAAGWLLCFAWHLYLVNGVRRCVRQGLNAGPGQGGASPREVSAGTVHIHSLSGLYRMARVGRRDD